jgi:hypothetical protein
VHYVYTHKRVKNDMYSAREGSLTFRGYGIPGVQDLGEDYLEINHAI